MRHCNKCFLSHKWFYDANNIAIVLLKLVYVIDYNCHVTDHNSNENGHQMNLFINKPEPFPNGH